MARALTIYIQRENVPARKPLQQALDALGLHCKLDADYAPFETSGYLPVDFDGEDAGFDLRFKDVDAAAAHGGRDVSLALKWAGDPREEAAAALFGAALAKSFGALVVRDGAEVAPEALVATAKKALA